MYLRELKLRTFRNYADLDFLPGPGLNVIVGDNAQGKSNLLEAVYLLATTRSLRASRESEMITTGAEAATVWGDLSREKENDVQITGIVARPGEPKNIERTPLGTFRMFSQDNVVVAGGESFRTSFSFVIPMEIEPSGDTTLGTRTWRVEVWGSVVNGFNFVHPFVIDVR